MSKVKVSNISRSLQEASIDVFICSSSFEDRCFDIASNIKLNIDHKFVFYNSNEDTKIIKNAKTISELLGENVRAIALNSDNPIGNFISISNAFDNVFLMNRFNVFLDTTTFTHETLLVILKILHNAKDCIDNLIIGYVGASEYSYNVGQDSDKWLSKGIKDIRTIIGFSGYSDPTLKSHLIILFGFESDRTQSLIEYYEFNKVSLGFVEVGNAIQSNHYKINYQRHCELLEMYPFAEKFDFSLINPISTKSTILSLVKKNPQYNTVVAPMNNKISTIGAGLAAIDNLDIQISYAKPLIYNATAYSRSNGIV